MRSFSYLLVLLIAAPEAIVRHSNGGEICREDFPKDFVFGSGTSAYQWEGAAAEDGRTPGIWDTYCHHGEVIDKSTGDVTTDGYHKYKEDVELMAEAGLEAYRFSISWTRIIPSGRGPVNPLGLKFYNNLIDELIRHGIQPHVTLLHYDNPQSLEDEYEGWLSSKIVDDFTAYADVCFKEFGDRVSFWTTLNEPNVFALGGYDLGFDPPKRCSHPFGINCTVGNSTTEPYIALHNMLLAHAAAASLYRSKYQAKQQGRIGLNFFGYYFVPLSNSFEDRSATERAYDFFEGWIVEPLVHGDYPSTMRKRVGQRLPSFSRHQKKQIVNSFDFLGINYYATAGIQDSNKDENGMTEASDFLLDLSVDFTEVTSPTDKFNSFGLKGLLEHIKVVYNNPLVYIHENGFPMPHNSMLNDTERVEHLSAHIESLRDAVRNGSNVKGYLSWSLMDVFELQFGFQSTYGLYYVDFADKELKRIPKFSAKWYSNFLKGRDDTKQKNIPNWYASVSSN